MDLYVRHHAQSSHLSLFDIQVPINILYSFLKIFLPLVFPQIEYYVTKRELCLHLFLCFLTLFSLSIDVFYLSFCMSNYWSLDKNVDATISIILWFATNLTCPHLLCLHTALPLKYTPSILLTGMIFWYSNFNTQLRMV